ncbi:MAG: MOSC domain-containing protein, partial [Oxalobacteraceae bacterium]
FSPPRSERTDVHLSSIFTYPVKSLAGHAMQTASVTARGIVGDRRWMVIDERDRFVTRREVPALARLSVEPTTDGLVIASGSGGCRAVTPGSTALVVEATVWRDKLALRLGNQEADAFLSAELGRPVRLAYQHDDSRRPIDSRFSQAGDHVSLADGFPLLITTEASLHALNDRLTVPVTMERFRPNLVIAGAGPWEEDRWRRIRIGSLELEVARPCSRCVVITQQPHTGERLEGNEPLATLRAMGRSTKEGVLFGQNAILRLGDNLSVGDKVEIVE